MGPKKLAHSRPGSGVKSKNDRNHLVILIIRISKQFLHKTLLLSSWDILTVSVNRSGDSESVAENMLYTYTSLCVYEAG